MFLQPVSARRHRAAILSRLLSAEGNPDKKAGALLAVCSIGLIGLGRVGPLPPRLSGLRYDFLSQKPETRSLLWLLLFLLGTSVVFFTCNLRH